MVDDREHRLYTLAEKIVHLGNFYGFWVGSPHGRCMEDEIKRGVPISEKYLPGRMMNEHNFEKEELDLMKDLKQKHFNGRIL